MNNFQYEPLSTDTPYYILSTRWYTTWEYFMTYNSSNPGPIKNKELINEHGDIKDRKYERHDYIFIPESVWERLHSKFGGGPKIVKYCAIDSQGSLYIEVRELNLKFVRSGDKLESESTVRVSRQSPIRLVFDLVVREYQLDPNNIRLFDFQGKSKWKCFKDLDKTFDEYEISTDQHILIEERLPNGKWPSKKFYTKLEQSFSYGDPQPPGKTGLGNLGNTCYMNSSLQCLSATVPLTDFFLTGLYKNDINLTNPFTTGVYILYFLTLGRTGEILS